MKTWAGFLLSSSVTCYSVWNAANVQPRDSVKDSRQPLYHKLYNCYAEKGTSNGIPLYRCQLAFAGFSAT